MCMECLRLKNADPKVVRYKKMHKAKNRQRYTELGREYKKKWNKENPNYFTEYAIKRNKVLRNATPLWADLSMITTKYKERDCMSKLTGLAHHVDHIVPLQGKNICGLHVAANLRVILARDNLVKHNKWKVAA
jgi:5-methylcytosine-specific restriction endonuclease McrA